MFEDGRIACSYCYNPCSEIVFETSTSSAAWPADSYIVSLLVAGANKVNVDLPGFSLQIQIHFILHSLSLMR